MRRVMRLVMCALSVSAFAPRALADDFDVLRGAQPVAPATFTRWSGFYFGGQVGYSNALADFSGATEPLLAYSLRELYLENETLEDEFSPLSLSSGRYSAMPTRRHHLWRVCRLQHAMAGSDPGRRRQL